MVRLNLLPREQKFFDLYIESVSNVVHIARMLREMVEKCDDMEGRTAKIIEIEEAEDRVTHQIIADIHRTFVTPFDREDMAKLADSLDDITDFIEGAAESMHLYKAECPVDGAKEMADVIIQMAIEVEKINEKMIKQNRKYILMGQGRWGSRDRHIGIPVCWSQISNAKVIVEISLSDFPIDASLGSHFFHNITSMNIGYLSVLDTSHTDFVRWDILNQQKIIEKTSYLRHVRFEKPLTVYMDGREKISVIITK